MADTETTLSKFDADIAKRCVKKAEDRFGAGWALMSAEIREMAVSHEVMMVLLAQHEIEGRTAEFTIGIARGAYAVLEAR
jgi:hypothetical protein